MSSRRSHQDLLVQVLQRDAPRWKGRGGPRCHWCDHPIRTHRQLRLLIESNRSTFGYREATLDHVTPRSEGGSDDLSNLVAACAPCNVERSRASQTKQSPKLERPPQVSIDHDFYIQRIPWLTPPHAPSRSGLYLVVKPSTFRVHLVSVLVDEKGDVFLLQGDRILPWEKFWFCRLDDLLSPSTADNVIPMRR